MAVQIEYPGGDVQWLYGGNPSLPVHQQKVPAGTKVISMAPNKSILDWSRRPAPFAEKYDSHVFLFRTHQYNWMRREYMHAGERF